jgi:hypothetical protein
VISAVAVRVVLTRIGSASLGLDAVVVEWGKLGKSGDEWRTVLVAGLIRGGVNVAGADFVVGTSAGSRVGAVLPCTGSHDAERAR